MIRLLFLSLFFLVNLYPQEYREIDIAIGNQQKKLSAYYKGNIAFVSVNELAQTFGVNHFYNPSNKKIEMKFNSYILKITAKNPFVVLASRRGNETETYQLPLTTLSLKGEIFIPLHYSSILLEKCFEKRINFSASTGYIAKTEKPSVDVPIIKPETKTETPPTPAFPPVDVKITIDEKANGTLITIKPDKKVSKIEHQIRNDTLRILFTNSGLDQNKIQRTSPKGLVQGVDVSTASLGTVLNIALKKDYATYDLINDGGKDILVSIHNKKFERKDSKADAKKDRWLFDVVVIDPGHGGKDYGAIGIGNAIEKDINLAIALKLGELIKENLKDVKVVYTRKDDTFIELYKRGKIANENNGKLFISIHCNSAPKKNSTPNGFEVYLLRPGRTDEAIAIAEFENSVIQLEDNPNRYEKLTDENFILVSMAHSSYMKYSEKFAGLLDNHVRQNLKINSRGVKQAGFYVLVGASMPSVLVEAGFLSNKSDADYLKSTRGQYDIAEAIFNSVKSFKTYYDTVIESD